MNSTNPNNNNNSIVEKTTILEKETQEAATQFILLLQKLLAKKEFNFLSIIENLSTTKEEVISQSNRRTGRSLNVSSLSSVLNKEETKNISFLPSLCYSLNINNNNNNNNITIENSMDSSIKPVAGFSTSSQTFIERIPGLTIYLQLSNMISFLNEFVQSNFPLLDFDNESTNNIPFNENPLGELFNSVFKPLFDVIFIDEQGKKIISPFIKKEESISNLIGIIKENTILVPVLQRLVDPNRMIYKDVDNLPSELSSSSGLVLSYNKSNQQAVSEEKMEIDQSEKSIVNDNYDRINNLLKFNFEDEKPTEQLPFHRVKIDIPNLMFWITQDELAKSPNFRLIFRLMYQTKTVTANPFSSSKSSVSSSHYFCISEIEALKFNPSNSNDSRGVKRTETDNIKTSPVVNPIPKGK
jgi:hypothetical protein